MEKTFYLQKKSLAFFVIGLLSLVLAKWCIVTQPYLLMYQYQTVGLVFYLIEENFTLISFAALFFLPLAFVIGCERLIVTDTYYVRQHFIKKEKYARKEFRIIEKGSFKEETGHGDHTSTERWKQLDIVDQKGKIVTVIKARVSQKSYQAMVTYFKVIELVVPVDSVQLERSTLNEDFAYQPKGDQKLRSSLSGWFFTVLTVSIFYVVVTRFFHLIISEQTAIFLTIVFAIYSLWKNIDWRSKQPLTLLSVRQASLTINGCCYLDADIILVELTSSQENFLNNDYFLVVTYHENGKKCKECFGFKLKTNQVGDYQKIEEKIIEKYGILGKYGALMGDA